MSGSPTRPPLLWGYEVPLPPDAGGLFQRAHLSRALPEVAPLDIVGIPRDGHSNTQGPNNVADGTPAGRAISRFGQVGVFVLRSSIGRGRRLELARGDGSRHTLETMPGPKKDIWDEQRRLERRARRRQEYHRGLRPFAIAAWEITKEHNVGSLVRTAHATAATEVLLIGDRDWNVEAARTAELYTSVIQLPDAAALINHTRENDYTLVSIELHDRSVNLFDAVYPDRPCFLLGAERGGVPEELIDESALIVQLPQWGLIPSLNLAVAGSVVVYDYLAKRHRDGKLARPDGGLLDKD